MTPDQPDLRNPGIAELVASTGVVDGRALDGLHLPVMIIDLTDGVVCAATQPIADVLGIRLDQLIGAHHLSAIPFVDPQAVERSMDAVRQGWIEGYRVTRQVRLATGIKEIAGYCRVVELGGKRFAVYVLGDLGAAAHHIVIPTLALERLVVGSLDADWHVERVSADVETVLGWDPRRCDQRTLTRDVHPDDIGDLVRVVEHAPAGETCALRLRLLHKDGSWVSVQALFVRVSPAEVAFAWMPDYDAPQTSPGRVSELEQRLQRIAAELRAAGIMDDVVDLPLSREMPQLNGLTARQLEIMVRLLRGDRVPTIARDIHLAPGTVRNHLAAIFARFGVHTQAELIARVRPRLRAG